MPVTLAATDQLEFRAYCQDNEQGSVNTYHYSVLSVSGVGATDQDAAAAFSTLIAPPYKSLLTTGVIYQGVSCRVLNRLPLPAAALSSSGTGAGTAGNPGMGRQLAGLMKFQTGFAGPGYRGRTYFPFPAAADTFGDGAPSVGYNTRLIGLAGDLFTFAAFTAGGITVDLSFSVYKRVPKAMIAITAYGVSPFWATQKRRGSFGRPNVGPF